jgi:hypothetical protein
VIPRPEIVSRLEEIGGNLVLDADGGIRYRVPKHNPRAKALLEQLREEKPALVAYLKARATQTPVSEQEGNQGDSRLLERMESSARQFGQPYAQLFPLIGKEVWTRRGKGRLLTVFATGCEVCPEGAKHSFRVRPEDVRLLQ